MGLPFEIHDQHSKSTHLIWSNKAAQSMLHGKENVDKKPVVSKKLCICSGTTHAGSFKCRLHRSNKDQTHAHPLHSALNS